MIRILNLLLCVWFTSTTAVAAPQAYSLDALQSLVGFTYRFNTKPTQGTMPIKSADIRIDFNTLQKTKIRVVLNIKKARAGFIFATDALKGESVLFVKKHPTIVFVSTSVRRAKNGAVVKGRVTIRGVTKDLTLNARFFRTNTADPTDHTNIVVLLTGSISRASFGASGFPDLVGDRIDLRIMAHLNKAG